MSQITWETVGSRVSKWGEGPIWWNGFLYYVDIESHLVIRHNPKTDEETVWNVGQRVGTVVPRKNGGLVFAGDNGIFFLDETSGAITPVCDPEPNKPNNRFNDGKCSPDGNFFAGTISLVKQTGDARLYRITPHLECTEAYGSVTTSNGIIWSLDGKTCYYIDTPQRCIMAFDYVDGALLHPRVVVNTGHIDASPDGMTIDTAGNLWVVFCHGACVCCFDPASGEELQRIPLPCLETTACAFGGDDLTDLYVTTGIHKSVSEEHGGKLFVVRGHGVQGVAANAFAG